MFKKVPVHVTNAPQSEVIVTQIKESVVNGEIINSPVEVNISSTDFAKSTIPPSEDFKLNRLVEAGVNPKFIDSSSLLTNRDTVSSSAEKLATKILDKLEKDNK